MDAAVIRDAVIRRMQDKGTEMFWKKDKKETAKPDFNKEGKKPVIRASICTGEKVAGFRDEKTGHIEELMLITGDKDLEKFMLMYDVKREEIEKVW